MTAIPALRPLLGIVAVITLAFASAIGIQQARAQDGSAEIEALVGQVAVLFTSGDIDAFGSLFTDEGLIAFVDDPEATTREEALAALLDFGFGDSEVIAVEIRDIEITGTTATAIVVLSIDGAFITVDRATLTEADGEWIISGWEAGVEPAPLPEIPAGYVTVPIDLDDYAFIGDTSGIEAGDSIAFEATNIGDEDHEIVFLKVPAGGDPVDAVGSDDAEFLAFTLAPPGEMGRAIVSDPLTPGRYVMICFIETAEEVPHFALGMVREFTLAEPATPTPTATPTTTPTATATTTATATATATATTPVAPKPPATGTGTTTETGASTELIALLVVLGVATVVTGGAFAARHRGASNAR